MTNSAQQQTQERHPISIRWLSIILGTVALVLSIACLVSINSVSINYRSYLQATNAYFSCQNAANDMANASDYLTSEVRIYVASQDSQHMEHYFQEVVENRRRDKAVAVLDEYLGNTAARDYLDQALIYSNELMEREEYAMRLVVEATGAPLPDIAETLGRVNLSEADAALSADEKVALAHSMVFDDTYQHYDDLIDQNVRQCKDALLDRMGDERDKESASLDKSLMSLQLFIVLIVIDFLVTLFSFTMLVLKPLYSFVHRIEQSEPLGDARSLELRYLSDTYNAMYEENRRTNEHLKRKSELDGLTNIYNRDVFDRLLEESDDKSVALVLADVDLFKEINDGYGHVMGDRVLQKVARQLERTFRQSDFACRIGGDEFAVLVMGVTSDMKPVIEEKVKTITAALSDTSDGLPAITLSIGVAFGPLDANHPNNMTLYTRADEALYQVKESGRNGCRFWH